MKNLLLLLTFFVTSSTVFSQLYVQPNGTTDSYVYVKDGILFVEQDVNLVLNTNNVDTEASIYLRNDAQLIQGASASNNKGTGSLSVYQTIDTTSNYHYTFWHSPVGISTNGVDGNLVAGVSRLYDIDNLTKSTQVATTTGSNGSSTTDPITISTKWIYTRTKSPQNEAEADYNHIGGADGIGAEEGFIMKGVSAGGPNFTENQIYDFRGRPYNGNINVPVDIGIAQWTLAGNPYASALDLHTFFNDNVANGLTAILYWDEPKDSEFHHNYNTHSGGYGRWIPGPGTVNDPGLYAAAPFKFYDAFGINGAGNGTGGVYDRRYAPIGQGFVLETNGANNIIEFKNSQRVYRKVGDVSDMRNQDNASSVSTTPQEGSQVPQIRINVEFEGGLIRQLLLAFSENSTDGYEVGLDAPMPDDIIGTDSYFPVGPDNNRKPFVIQTVPFSLEKRVPIAFNLYSQTTLSVSAVEKINIDGAVYLWDSQENIYRDITPDNSSVDPTDNSFILPAGNYENRYYIVFRGRRATEENSEGTIAKKEVRANVDFFQNNPVKQLEISNPEGYTIKSAAIYDMSGKLVVNKSNLGNSFKITVGTSNLADGVYLIKLLTSENINIDYKMIIQNK